MAFRLGANIVAYATGMEAPSPRLTPKDVAHDEPVPRKLPRGYVKAAQLQNEGDQQDAPRAMPNLMRQMREKAGLDVALQTEAIDPQRSEVIDFKFMYMHGRKGFDIPKDKLADLRFNLENGGLLFADAICGLKTFDQGFRKLMTDLFPNRKLEVIPMTEELYSKELNDQAITTVRCRAKRTASPIWNIARWSRCLKE